MDKPGYGKIAVAVITCPIWFPFLLLGVVVSLAIIGFRAGMDLVK